MKTGRRSLDVITRGGRGLALTLTAIAVVGGAVPAAAQVDEARMRKLEAEVRAMQRKVFPGTTTGGTFDQNAAAATGQTSVTMTPSTTALSDVLARLDAMEARLATLTSQVETNTNALARLTGRVAALEPATAMGTSDTGAYVPPATTITTPKPTPTPTATPRPVAPSNERLARVQAITKPASGDAGEDEYSYGYRLWEAKLYPEAQQQLQLYVQKYPTHKMISYGRNLLGRAYLDEGKPKEAASWFVKNYDGDAQGARAADSLLYLSESMIVIKDTKRACIALAKFSETYPALATGRLKAQYDSNRAKVKCN